VLTSRWALLGSNITVKYLRYAIFCCLVVVITSYLSDVPCVKMKFYCVLKWYIIEWNLNVLLSQSFQQRVFEGAEVELVEGKSPFHYYCFILLIFYKAIFFSCLFAEKQSRFFATCKISTELQVDWCRETDYETRWSPARPRLVSSHQRFAVSY